ncbi:PAS domain S-box-containing protein [Rhizobiales bacterium GAS191]|nr:PAS domain S-box-containing protein [Rhizobiales bacterium GAS191]
MKLRPMPTKMLARDAPRPASRALSPFLPAFAAAFAIAIFVLDATTKIDIAIAVLYVAVVLMSVSFCSPRGVLAVSGACMVLTVLAFVIMHRRDYDDTSVGRCIVALSANAMTTFLALRMQSATASIRSQAQLLDLSHDTIFVRDMNDVITYWNRRAEELYGWPRAQALGQTTHRLIQTQFPAAREEVMAQLLHTGRWEGELVHTRRDGSEVTVASRWSLQRDERGRPTAILETNTDITGRKRAQETLAKAQAELAHVTRVATLGELTASIAHEVNQPLAGIVTNGEACLRWLERDVHEEVKNAVERMISDGRRAGEVVRHLRELSRKGNTQNTPLNLDDVVEDALPLVQREVSNHRVSLALDLAGDLPMVLGDRVQLQQVIINLLVNAIQAMAPLADRPRELVIRTRQNETDQVLVMVQDSGPGIDPEIESQLFNAFFTTKSDGMGMGLSICRSIIEAHGGRVWASQNAEAGATFQFALPSHGKELS